MNTLRGKSGVWIAAAGWLRLLSSYIWTRLLRWLESEGSARGDASIRNVLGLIEKSNQNMYIYIYQITRSMFIYHLKSNQNMFLDVTFCFLKPTQTSVRNLPGYSSYPRLSHILWYACLVVSGVDGWYNNLPWEIPWRKVVEALWEVSEMVRRKQKHSKKYWCLLFSGVLIFGFSKLGLLQNIFLKDSRV